jgi:hypothetical protein
MKKTTCFVIAAALILCLSPPIYAAASAGAQVELSFTYTPAEPGYIVEVSGTWFRGSQIGLTATCNAEFSKFIGVKVDGILLDADMYIAASGSTVITLKPEYLMTLDIGEHSIQLLFTDGSVQTWFTIKAPKVLVSAATTAKDFVSITETVKNSRVWVLTFKAMLVYSDGTTEVVTHSIYLSGNNANLDGKYKFGDGHALAGYTLVYDIKGNGSNIKDFRLIRN